MGYVQVRPKIIRFSSNLPDLGDRLAVLRHASSTVEATRQFPLGVFHVSAVSLRHLAALGTQPDLCAMTASLLFVPAPALATPRAAAQLQESRRPGRARRAAVILRRAQRAIVEDAGNVRERRVAEPLGGYVRAIVALWEDPVEVGGPGTVGKRERARRMAERMKALWKDPEFRARMMESRRRAMEEKANAARAVAGERSVAKSSPRSKMMKEMWRDPDFRNRVANGMRNTTWAPEERAARSARLRAKWQDPAWRGAVLEKRRNALTTQKLSEAARIRWQNPEYRARMRQSRLGRVAYNKGVSPSKITRLRMSMARRGVKFSDETRKRMSDSKLVRPEGDTWPHLISESKRGKTREYFKMRREFRALHHDLKLWSDSYRSIHGRLPKASTYESRVAPMMVFRIRRYLTLRDSIGADDPKIRTDIITSD